MKRLFFALSVAVSLVACTKTMEPAPQGCAKFVQLWYRNSKPTPDTIQNYYVNAATAATLRAQGEDGKIVLQNDTLKVVHRLVPTPCK